VTATRLPLVSLPAADEITAAVFEAFAREGRAPIALYRALANAPVLLRAYATLARALRHEAETPRALRELVILRIAQLTGSRYEWAHHRAMAAKASVAEEKIRALADWRAADVFDPRERAALRCADEIHDLALSDDGFGELRERFSASEIVELVLLTAFYEAIARLIQAFGLDVEPAYRGYLDPDE
jgi:AhpD family alkylhydroperoxidase